MPPFVLVLASSRFIQYLLCKVSSYFSRKTENNFNYFLHIEACIFSLSHQLMQYLFLFRKKQPLLVRINSFTTFGGKLWTSRGDSLLFFSSIIFISRDLLRKPISFLGTYLIPFVLKE